MTSRTRGRESDINRRTSRIEANHLASICPENDSSRNESSGDAHRQPAVCPHSFCVLCENRGAPGSAITRELLEELRARARGNSAAQEVVTGPQQLFGYLQDHT
jgi:hypothetical protein